MVYINEWLPNPVGKDDPAEFIELFNRSSSTVSLNGWALWSGGKGKAFFLSGYSIKPDGYLVLKKAQTKISLKNTDGALFLYRPDGKLADQGAFIGAAPIGKSFSRAMYGTENTQQFSFLDATPGAANETIKNEIAIRHYPLNVPLDAPLGAIQFAGFMVSAAVIITAAWAYIIYKNENLSQLIFKRDAKTR